MISTGQPLPDLTRPDAGATLISKWIVGVPDRLRAAADALLAEWRGLSARYRPAAFRQLSCFASEDGRALLSVAQWTSDEAHLAFARQHRPELIAQIDQAIPGIQRPGLVHYRRHRGVVWEHPQPASGPVVLVRAEAADRDQARSWADSVVAAVKPTRRPGVTAAHVLLSASNAEALLYLEGTPTPERPWAAVATPGVCVAEPESYWLVGIVPGPQELESLSP